MRALSVVLAMVLCLCTGALSVQVNVEEQSFPLESVKDLVELLDLDDGDTELPQENVEEACKDPLLPKVFQRVCREEGTYDVFSELVKIISSADSCERCSNPACTGCKN
ncbi:guanylate cyclase activator 2B-like [Stegastes partitus]|uniref:Guanylate cyclase activator 2B n=1 Tax=Stegastes partitus TaxID=144197 RepID=A0A9Y4U3Z0_9TELE|nr:PREDICTED: guanylate cyclase activator 2B-like [Stegastes partitus]